MSDSERVWQKFSKFSLASNNSGVLGVFRVRTKLLSHNFSTCETTFVAILQSVSLACKLQAHVCRADARPIAFSPTHSSPLACAMDLKLSALAGHCTLFNNSFMLLYCAYRVLSTHPEKSAQFAGRLSKTCE